MVHETYLVKVGSFIASLSISTRTLLGEFFNSSGVQNVEDIFGITFIHA